MEYLVGTPGDVDCICMIRNYIPIENADKIYSFYRDNIPWKQTQHDYNYGSVNVPRLQHYCGDKDVYIQTYAGNKHDVKTWDPVSKEIRNKVVSETKVYFDSALLNYYRSGDDYIAHHSDRECSKLLKTVVGVSFGGTRRFYFKRVSDGLLIKSYMNNGDAVVISGECQALYTHGIPKQKGVEPRISITFRSLLGKHIPWNGELDD